MWEVVMLTSEHGSNTRLIRVVKIMCEQNKIFKRGFLVLLLVKFRTHKDRKSI